jgi:hypothetical protein
MSVTELDDLKTAWQMLNRNVERQSALTLHYIKETKLSRFRAGFRPLVVGQIIQLIAGLVLAIFGGSFWVDHIRVPHLMFYGLSVHAYGLMFIVFAARDLFLISQLDYTAPVLALQKQVAELRAWHMRTAFWFAVVGCLIWIPVLLILFYKRGADVWLRNPSVIGWFFVSGLVPLALFAGVVLWSRRPGREKFAESLEKNSAGRSLNRAQAALDEIARFEAE